MLPPVGCRFGACPPSTIFRGCGVGATMHAAVTAGPVAENLHVPGFYREGDGKPPAAEEAFRAAAPCHAPY